MLSGYVSTKRGELLAREFGALKYVEVSSEESDLYRARTIFDVVAVEGLKSGPRMGINDCNIIS